ncbi:MAG TPA: hypothetical protein PKE16_10450 [Hyphomicrobium sp.]|nr:hypothetical protein [Hyphomicrobium sp.]
MPPTDVIAIYAAIVATGVLVWDVYKWRRTERVRLVGRVMTNAIAVGGYPPGDRKTKYVCLTIDNRGHLACTITHFIVLHYKSWFHELRGNSDFQALVNTHGGQGNDVPYELRPGGKSFMGTALQTKEIEDLSRAGRLYIAIIHTLADKPFRVRVQPIKSDADTSPVKTNSPEQPRASAQGA